MKITEIIKESDDNLKGRFYSALKGNQSVILAYGEGSGRNLDIRGTAVSLDEWQKVMDFALSDTDKYYNDFTASKVADEMRGLLYEAGIGEDELKFIPGRENSVVLYILGPEHYLKEMEEEIQAASKYFCRVNEVNVYPDGRKDTGGPALRLWWD